MAQPSFPACSRPLHLDRRAFLAGLAGGACAIAGFGRPARAFSLAMPQPPQAAAAPETRVFSGHAITDPYAWLENPDDPAVIAYLEAENAYTDAIMEQPGTLRDILVAELEARDQRNVTYPPLRIGPYHYYVRTEEGKDYPIYCRRVVAPGSPEQILLDLNAVDAESVLAGALAPSPDHRLLAYSLDTMGSGEYSIAFLDMETGATLPDRLSSDGYSLEWAPDSQTLFYVPYDPMLRPSQLRRHALGADPAADPLLYQEEDELFSIWLSRSDDLQYFILTSGSYTSAEARYLPVATPDGEFTRFAPRREGVQYSLGHAGGEFLVLTNERVRNFELLAVPDDPARRAQGRMLLAGDDRTL